MELPGSGYLYNLSVLAVTFATVSALVMLVRQTLGGKLSNFDIFLLRGFVSFSLFVAFAAILPPLVALSGAPARVLWPLTSAVAAILLALKFVHGHHAAQAGDRPTGAGRSDDPVLNPWVGRCGTCRKYSSSSGARRRTVCRSADFMPRQYAVGLRTPHFIIARRKT